MISRPLHIRCTTESAVSGATCSRNGIWDWIYATTRTSRAIIPSPAIRKVPGGGAFISAEVAQQLALGAMPDAKGPPHAALSDREFQIFRMIADGLSVSDIAARLSLSVKTVSTHKSNILQKMNMSTQAELIRYAITNRLVDDSGEAG